MKQLPVWTVSELKVLSCTGEPIEGKDIVGDDWVMTDLSGADAPTAPIGALSENLQ